jgi:hypothetical protein
VSIRDVDAFLRRYAAPVLDHAGYRRRSRTYMTDGSGGRQAIVEFTPEVTTHQTALQVAYGVTTPAHREFRESRGVPQVPWPPVTASLLHGMVQAPELARTGAPGAIPPERWVLGDDEHTAEVGEAFARALEREVLPRINSWFDPEVLARTLQHRPPATFPGLSPRPRAVAMALLEVDGAEERLQETLALLPPDDMVRVWIEDQLAKRSTPTE